MDQIILPDEIVLIILKFCQKLHYKDKCIRLLFPRQYKLIYFEKKDWINKHFDVHIINIIGGFNKMITTPIIEFKKHFQYKPSKICFIDNIKPYDMEENLMIGVDYYNRGFICLKRIENETELVEIIFQLYENKKIWKHTTCQAEYLNTRNNFVVINGKKVKLLYDNFKNYIKNIY